MDHDIRAARIATLKRYLQNEVDKQPQEQGADSKVYSMFLHWYTEKHMAGSRTRTVVLAKRMLAELMFEQEDTEVHG